MSLLLGSSVWVPTWRPWLVLLLWRSPTGRNAGLLTDLAHLGDRELCICKKKNHFPRFHALGCVCFRGIPHLKDCWLGNKHDLLWYISGPPCGEQTVKLFLLGSQTVTFLDLILFFFSLLLPVKFLCVLGKQHIVPGDKIFSINAGFTLRPKHTTFWDPSPYSVNTGA